MTLASGIEMAGRVINAIGKYCDAIAVAGSIRRHCPIVKDIDIVILPKPNGSMDIRERVKWNSVVDADGPEIMRISHNGVQIDLFFARAEEKGLFETVPTNFGSVLLCRTGSKEHNIRLIERAKTLDLRWSPNEGVFQGNRLIASRTEEDIFTALQLPFINPIDRK